MRPARNMGWSSTSSSLMCAVTVRPGSEGRRRRGCRHRRRAPVAACPPRSAARACIDSIPTPGIGCVGSPAPSSSTVTCSRPSAVTATAQRRAWAWRAELLIASTAMRYAAVSTAVGSGGSPSAATVTVNSPGRLSDRPRSSSAPTSPSSSSPGGRRSSRIRRTSRQDVLASDLARFQAACRLCPGPNAATAERRSTRA